MAEKTKAGRPAKWSGPTTAIRVPQHLADHLLDIARQLDNPESANNVQNPNGLPKTGNKWMPPGEGIGVGSFVGRLPSEEDQHVVARVQPDGKLLLWSSSGWITYDARFVRAKSEPDLSNLRTPAWNWLSHLCSVLGSPSVRELLDEVIREACQLDGPETAEAEGWISHKLPDYPLKMLTSESQSGTYRLFLEPPRPLPPAVEASIEEYCDRVFDGLTETERVFLLGRLVEELGEKVNA